MKKLVIVPVMALALVLTACGNVPKTDAAKGVAALMSKMNPGNSGLIAARIEEAREILRGDAWAKRFQAEADMIEAAEVGTLAYCDAITSGWTCTPVEGEGLTDENGTSVGTCTNTCEGTTQKSSCTLSASMSLKCGTTTYVFSNGTFDTTFPAPTCTEDGTKVTQKFSFIGTFAMDIQGGEITEAVRLECKMASTFGYTFDTADPTAGGTETNELTEDGFSCTVDGTAIDFADFKAELAANSCSSSGSAAL